MVVFLPFHKELDDFFRSDHSVWWKIIGGAQPLSKSQSCHIGSPQRSQALLQVHAFAQKRPPEIADLVQPPGNAAQVEAGGIEVLSHLLP